MRRLRIPGYGLQLIPGLLASSALVFVLFLVLLRSASAKQPAPAPTIIPDNYIIFLKDNVVNLPQVASDMARQHGFAIDEEYDALNGFAAVIPSARLNAVSADPRVLALGPVRQGYGGGQVASTGLRRIGGSSDGVHQTLKRKGLGIGVAVLDTGIDPTHADLPVYVSGYSCIKGTKSPADDNGHGTAVTGIIAAFDNDYGIVGVAPAVDLYAVKVLDANNTGTTKTFTCGVNWVTANAKTQAGSQRIHVVNMSLWMPAPVPVGPSNADCTNSFDKKQNDALHTAICKSVKAGVTYVVIAGNDMQDALGFVPAAYGDPLLGGEVITVSALVDTNGRPGRLGPAPTCANEGNQQDDTFWWQDQDPTGSKGSNFGPAVTIAAPGVCILTTWPGNVLKYFTGTSAAAPFVAGAAALYKEAFPTATPAQVKDGLVRIWEPGPIPGDPDTFSEGVLRLAVPMLYVTISTAPSLGLPPQVLVLYPSGNFSLDLDQATVPRSVAVANGYLYVANNTLDNRSVLVFNAAPPCAQVATIALPPSDVLYGVWVAASPNGKFVYAAGYGPAKGYEIDTTTNTVSRSFTVSTDICPTIGPCTLIADSLMTTARVAVNPATGEAWFTGSVGCNCPGGGFTGGYVVPFGGSASAIKDMVADSPIAISSSGTIYVETSWGIYALPGGLVASQVSDIGADIALTPDDTTLYITAPHLFHATGNVYIFDTATTLLTPLVIPVGAHPQGVAITPDGTNAFVSDFFGGVFYVIDTATHAVGSVTVREGLQHGVAAALVPLF